MKNGGQFNLGSISRYRNELYGIAIILIVVFHFFEGVAKHPELAETAPAVWLFALEFNRYIGSIGVELFVFLSGMSMYYSYSGSKSISAFYGRRYRRILIPYLYVGTIFWIIKDISIKGKGWLRVLQDLSYQTFFTEGVRTIWFILFLVAAYAIVPPVYSIVFRDNRIRIIPAALIMAVLLCIPVLIYGLNPDAYNNIEVAATRFPLFAAGMITGRFIKDGRQINFSVAFVLIILAAGLRMYGVHNAIPAYASRYISSVFGVGLIIVLVFLLRYIEGIGVFDKTLRFFGEYSLEIYLLHVTMRNIMMTLDLPYQRVSVYSLMAIAAVVLSVVLHRLTDLTEQFILRSK